MRIIVAGGGWAGLATAVELTRHGASVTLLEAGSRLGGRARSIEHNGLRLDNGQHLLLGAYRDTLRLLEVLGVPESSVVARRPLELLYKSPHRPDIRLACPFLPAPLHLVTALLRAEGLTVGERLNALSLCRGLLASGFAIEHDIPLATWLEHQRQSLALIRALWQPLCLAVLNTPLHEASTQVFLRVLQDAFTRSHSDSHLLLTRTDLGQLLPQPAQRFIERHGGEIKLNHRVQGLAIEDNVIHGVTANGQTITADHVVLAVPPIACQRLLAPHPALHGIARQLAAMGHEPICTVYLQYPPQTRLPIPMVGLLDTTAQWVFDRALYGQQGLMAVVISGPGPHMAMSKAELSVHAANELSSIFPHWPVPQHSISEGVVIREKYATFSCRANINALRPQAETPIRGLWLAGDYTDTGYPATLEGAVRSGVTCARGIKQR